jgi:hypothetical protein
VRCAEHEVVLGDPNSESITWHGVLVALIQWSLVSGQHQHFVPQGASLCVWIHDVTPPLLALRASVMLAADGP